MAGHRMELLVEVYRSFGGIIQVIVVNEGLLSYQRCHSEERSDEESAPLQFACAMLLAPTSVGLRNS
jgi:hypothetical protein